MSPSEWTIPERVLRYLVHTQLQWLTALGFDDVDCCWTWLEMALLVGVKPRVGQGGAHR